MEAIMLDWKKGSTVLIIALAFCLLWPGRGCPYEGSDHRLLGRTGCWIQRKLTIKGARPPHKLWSFDLAKVSNENGSQPSSLAN